MVGAAVLSGTVRADGVLKGTVEPSMTAPRYPGPYDVTPAADAQALATKGLVMDSDVTVGGMGEAIEKAGRDAIRTVVDGSYTGEYRDEGVTALRSGAFQGCTGLTSVDLPAATSIGASAFQGCTGLTSVELPAATSIGSNAFQGCTGLTSVELPNLSQMTGSYQFQGCTGLTSVELPNLSQMTGFYQFQGCTGLEEINIPCRYLMNNYYTFQECTSLRRVVLPQSTHDDGWRIYYGCTALRCIDLGKKGTFYQDLPDSALFDTLILRDASGTYNLSKPAQLSNTKIAAGTGYIYVPRALVDKYKAATNWSVYADQFRAIEDYPEICDPE